MMDEVDQGQSLEGHHMRVGGVAAVAETLTENDWEDKQDWNWSHVQQCQRCQTKKFLDEGGGCDHGVKCCRDVTAIEAGDLLNVQLKNLISDNLKKLLATVSKLTRQLTIHRVMLVATEVMADKKVWVKIKFNI